MGLLQEGILSCRVTASLRADLRGCQSGYIRDVQDPHLLLHEVVSMRRQRNMPTWLVMADYVKAFPRTWRDDLLVILAEGPQLQDGAFALLADILARDEVVINQSGWSVVELRHGLPEGGTIGPLTYTSLPNTLMKELLAGHHGVSMKVRIPSEWSQHVWLGLGRPIPALVDQLFNAITTGSALPPPSLLSAWSDLEASALRAIDLMSSPRVPVIFHADDPVIVASSKGAAEEVLDVMLKWSKRHNAKLHVSPKKTVSMACNLQSDNVPPELQVVNTPDGNLTSKHVHRWLGAMWPHDLNFTSDLHAKMQAASAAFAPLVSLVCKDVIPLTYALKLFEIKVESILCRPDGCGWPSPMLMCKLY